MKDPLKFSSATVIQEPNLLHLKRQFKKVLAKSFPIPKLVLSDPAPQTQ